MNAVELRDVSLVLGGHRVLSGVDLAIGGEEFVGVFGSNGAGKTTLMRAILGLLPAAQGAIEVFGLPASRGNPAIGYMPQARTGMSHLRLNGFDVVASVIEGHRLGLPHLSKAAQSEVAWALDMVGAEALAHRPVAEMSGGERQLILLAQALVGHPKLLRLDEPLISLDPPHQRSVVELTRRLQQELKMTVLFSAHELNPLLGALDRVLYLGGGHAALGTVDEVITGPVLSRLYQSPIEVVRLKERIFVMSGEFDLERQEHRHDHDAHL
ncbi:MAG TPA: ATP-binding cassette domain-containing protein [Beijerinckiaceae bacterium]|nr:ATP-binding cassette domain-containing protein [Beijerinckiaceae bacterium]